MRLAALLVVAACGLSTPPGGGPPPPPPPDAPLPPLAEGCPARFDQAGGMCDFAVASSTCHYPEGHCYCGVVPVCSGAVRPPDEGLDEPLSWVCTANPPAFRDDGCPGREPNGACDDDGKRCTYGSCCVATYECDGRQWQYAGGECPP